MPGIFTFALLAALAASSVAPGAIPPLAPPTDRADTIAQAPTVAGDLPAQLMLDPAVGTTQVIELSLVETFKTWDNNAPTFDATLPPRTLTIALEVIAEDLSTDERTIAYRIESVAIDDNAFTGNLPDNLKQSSRNRLNQMRTLTGLTGTFTLHAMGFISDITSQPPADADKAAIDAQLRVVTVALSSLIPAIPAEPVGLNARWKIESLDQLGSSSVRWPISCELTSLAGDNLHVTMTGETYIDVTIEKLPELPQNVVNTKAERRYSIATTTIHDPRLPAPSESTSALTIRLDADYREDNQPATFRSESVITTTLRERSQNVVFRLPPLSPEEQAAQAALESTALALISDGTADGDEPREIAYPAGAGPCELTFASALAQVSTGKDPTGGLLPAVRCSFDVASDATATTWVLRDFRIAGDNQPKAVVDTLTTSLKGVVAKPMPHPSVAARVFSKATRFGDIPASASQPNMLLEVTSLWKPPLPFEPVAKGATWNFARPWLDSEFGAPIWQSGQATLVDLTADTFTIEYKISGALADDTHAVDTPYLNGLSRATLNSFTSGTRVRVTWKNDLPVPLEGEATHAQRTAAEVATWLMSGSATNFQSWTAHVRSAPAFTDIPVPAISAPTPEVLTSLERDASRATFRNFQLTSAGDEPRTQLAYRIEPADEHPAPRQVYCLAVRQRSAQSNGTQQQTAEGVTMHFVIALDSPPNAATSMLEPDETVPAFRNLRWELLRAFASAPADPTAQQQQLAQQYTTVLANLSGALGACSLQPTGELVFEHTVPAIGALPSEENALRELHEWIARFFVALPQDPVGLNAAWSHDTAVPLVGYNDPFRLTTTLTKREGELVTLTTTAQATARDRAIFMPGLPQGRAASALEAATTRTITATLDPTLVAPVQWTFLEVSTDQRAIKEGNTIIDWLYSSGQTAAALIHWPDYTPPASADATPLTPPIPTLPAFEEVIFPARPQ